MQLSELLRPGSVFATLAAVAALVASTYWGVTEEIQTRHLRGVVVTDQGETVPNARVMLNRWSWGGADAPTAFLRTRTDEHGEFLLTNVPDGTYDVTVHAPGYSADRYLYVGEHLESPTKIVLKWRGDSLYMSTNQTVFTPNEGGQVVINGLSREDGVAIDVYEVPGERISEERDFYGAISRLRWNRFDDSDLANMGELVHSELHKFTSRDIQGNFAEVVVLPELKTGVYIVKASLGQRVDYSWLTVSEIGLVTKSDPKGVLAFVVDIETGRPVQGAVIRFATSAGSKRVGTTAQDGTLSFRQSRGESGSRLVTAEHEGSKAYSSFYWSPNSDNVAVHIQTDRPVYRPGDTVFYKATVRESDDGVWRLPRHREATVEIQDPDRDRVSSTSVKVSGLGTFSGQFVMEDEELTGAYQITVLYDGSEHRHTVPAMSYRKSQFELSVEPLERFYLRGDVAKMKVTATFYTGEPVVGSKISATAYYSSIYYGSPFEDENFYDYEDDYYRGYGSYLDSFSATTDENGEAVIEIDTGLFDEVRYDQTLTLSVGVSDESGRYFSEDGRVVVARGEFDLDASFSSYVSKPGEQNDLIVTATRHKDGKPAVGESVVVEYGYERWSSRRANFEQQGTWRGRIGADGTVTFPVKPSKGGSFYAKVTMTDGRNNKIVSETHAWIYSYGARFGGQVPNLQIVLDKKKYEPDGTAKAIIRTSKPGGMALVTAEADTLLWFKVVELAEESTEIEFDDLERFAPNVSIRACYIRDKKFNSTSRTLTVELRDQLLKVEVTPSKDVVLPGEALEYIVKTTTPDGTPVRADVALSVVDEAVYAIREDRNDPLQTFYPRRWSGVRTSYSFPEIYLDGDDKSPIEVDMRKDFRDTAYWAPTVSTGPQGIAKIRVDLPDNLTEWRATATAITRDTKVGKGTGSVIARKKMMVRMSPPSFFVEGDVQTVGATVTNQSGRTIDVKVQMRGQGVSIDRNGVREVRLKDGESRRLTWVLTALEGESATIRLAAQAGGGLEDGVEMTVPVRLHGTTELQVAGETVDDVFSTTLSVDKAAVRGELRLEYAPTLLSSMIADLDRLVNFPYGCVEQTMHMFLPAVIVKSFLG
ncbi:MAG: carboxypeptidase regulatory-like domain-containing protein, partial [Armatimonadetes bacterium]|nr:carboxypeptidase regulatory-like domain-containing protein [Armatimonadota bacterium]